MFEIKPSSRFKKDIKSYRFNQKVLDEFSNVLSILQSGNKLPLKYIDHNLSGNLSDYRECHVFPDVLLMYAIFDDTILLARMGSHSTVFKK